MTIAARSRSVALTVALAVLTVGPATQAQDANPTETTKPKPKKKPAPPKKPAKTETKPAAEDESKPKPTKEEPKSADEEPKPAPDETKPAAEEGKAGEDEKKPAAEEAAKEVEGSMTDTREDPNVRYYFVGLRYRGTIIPKFIENLFVDEGSTVYSNTFGAELDMRKGGQSMIPWIVFTDLSMGDTLFHQKGATPTGTPGEAPNYSVVNSSLKAIFLGVDELWSVPIDQSHHWDFEFGFGVGLGFLFGNLQNNWVYYNNPQGPLVSDAGNHYSECQSFSTQTGCNSMDHQGNPPPKVGGYVEKNWFNGGSVPVVFPHISFPQLDVRYKPIKQMEARLSVGFSLTGFWFGLSADYGLEQPEHKGPKASGSLARLHDML
jgi:hypothetical protein